MSSKVVYQKDYEKDMLNKQAEHRQAMNSTVTFASLEKRITRNLDSFSWPEPVETIVSKKKSRHEVIGGSYLKYTQRPHQQNKK